jgi:hypothetical protein
LRGSWYLRLCVSRARSWGFRRWDGGRSSWCSRGSSGWILSIRNRRCPTTFYSSKL